MLRVCALAGDYSARHEPAEVLTARGDRDELRRRTRAGDQHAVLALSRSLREGGEDDQAAEPLRVLADTIGGDAVRRELADLLREQGRAGELRDRAAAGDIRAREMVDGL